MERKFLKDLGIADETVDKIMAENGKDVEKAKGDLADVKGQLETAKTTLKSFEGVNVEELKGKITQLTTNLDAKDKDYAAKLDDRDFRDALKSAGAGLKVKNIDAALAVLGAEKTVALKASKNREKDITDALKAQKEAKETAYLYETERTPRVVSSTSGPAKQTDDAKSKANEGLRSFFGKGEGE